MYLMSREKEKASKFDFNCFFVIFSYFFLDQRRNRQNAKKKCNELSINGLGFAFGRTLRAAGSFSLKLVKSMIEKPAIGSDYIKAYDHQNLLKKIYFR